MAASLVDDLCDGMEAIRAAGEPRFGNKLSGARMEQPIEVGPADWDAFESVMGPIGGSGGCWCMLWRLSAKRFSEGAGASNKAAMRRIFEEQGPPGLIARRGGAPVGWLQLAPRSDFPRLAGSRILKPVDALPVWSVSCFLVAKSERRRGVGVALLEAACDAAAANGAPALEGYPVEPNKTPYAPVFAFTGFAETYRRAGFAEVARRSPTRPIFRRMLSDGDGSPSPTA